MNKIFKIAVDKERAKALIFSAQKKFLETKKIYTLISKETIIENYYEIIKELIVAFMYLRGFKTLSHINLLEFLKSNCSSNFNSSEFLLINELRIKRNEITYYGKDIDESFLYQKEETILNLIKKMFNFLKKEFF